LELYANIKPYGRITFRDQGQTIAAGVILEFTA
jgi:translation elongation factor EF-1alpha